MTPTETLAAAMASLGLTVAAQFVPFSQSRNAANDPGNKPSARSLNWRVTIQRNGRDVLTTDYSAGIAHCPSYGKLGYQGRMTLDQGAAIIHETEKGTAANPRSHLPFHATSSGMPILPDSVAVMWALAQDASVLDSASFEDWASDFGYDSDSRTAETTYRACLDIALKLRAAIGDAGLETLRTAGEDY